MIETFKGMVEITKSHGEHIIYTLALLLVIGVGYTMFEKRSEIWDMMFVAGEISEQDFVDILKINNNIQTALDALRDETNAHKVSISRFHNGKYDLTGVPFEKITEVYSSSSAYYTPSKDSGMSLPLPALQEILGGMWLKFKDPVCISNNIKDYTDLRLISYLKTNKIEREVVCPITNITNYPLGILVVDLKGEPTPAELERIITLTNTTAQKVGGYLETKSVIRTPTPSH